MKKLLGISALAMLLTACSSSSNDPQQTLEQGPQAGAANPQVDVALKACIESVGQDQAKLDACMKERGFEKQPQQGTPMPTEQATPDAASAEVDQDAAPAKKAVKKVKKAKKSR